MGNMKRVLAMGMTPILAAGVFVGGIPAQKVQAATVETYNGHYYMFVDEVVDAATAEYKCDLSGAHLVTLTSAEEEAFVKEKLSGDKDFWLGAKLENQTWKWVTGEAFSYTNWHEDEPSCMSDENYMSTFEGYWDDCSWDKNGSGGNTYVMEWDSESAYQAYVSGDTKEMQKNIMGRTSHNGHSYKFYEMYGTWKETANYCKTLGGYLVTVTDKKENKFVYSLCGKRNIWIGMNDAKKEGKYTWVTKERTDYSNFGDDLNNDFDGTEDYIGFYESDKWNDYTEEGSSEGKLGFVCEWDDSNPTILTAVKSSIKIKAGKKAKLQYQIYPVKKKVTFKSSKKKVATVSKNGVVTAKKAGKCVITIKSGNKKVKVKVTVK